MEAATAGIMRVQIIAECCTNWGGDLGLMYEMILEAGRAGADWAKFQAYQVKYLAKTDPQYEWLAKCELTDAALSHIERSCALAGVRPLLTVFNLDDYTRAKALWPDLTTWKIGHGESSQNWWREIEDDLIVSWPWGLVRGGLTKRRQYLSVVPRYPAPPEAVFSATRVGSAYGLDGWSDHGVGLTAAKVAIVSKAKIVEKHFSLPGRGRNQAWDMDPVMLRELRTWADDVTGTTAGTVGGRWATLQTK